LVVYAVQAEAPLKKKLIGVWKIQWMEMKGLKMEHAQVGHPFVEFNEEGGFLIQVGGKSEKGKYSLHGDILKLNFISPPKPVQKMVISRLDEQELDYTTTDSSNVMKVKCYRVLAGQGEEKD
jgi:hypothetical protein